MSECQAAVGVATATAGLPGNLVPSRTPADNAGVDSDSSSLGSVHINAIARRTVAARHRYLGLGHPTRSGLVAGTNK